MQTSTNDYMCICIEYIYIPITPPKGIEVRDLYNFLLIFQDFGVIFIKNHVFIYGNWFGMDWE